MKKRGFTLIELLAVIVILAIIAFIATPIVMKVIENSKKGAAERSAENYIDAVETKVATERLDNKIMEGTYTIDNNGNLTGNGLTEPLIIEMSGIKPTSGSVTIENGQVVPTGTTMTIGTDYTVTYDGTKATATKNSTEVATSICKLKEGEALAIGSKYECTVKTGETQIFYVLEDGYTTELTPETGGIATPGTVSLIMDRNVGNNVAWVTKADYIAAGGTESDYGTYGNNNLGPKTALNYLKEQTSDWNVEAKLPTYDQIYQATGNKLDGFPTWLHDYLDSTTNSISGVYGYWTSTAPTYESDYVFYVSSDGSLDSTIVARDNLYGVRPVITISKSSVSE